MRARIIILFITAFVLLFVAFASDTNVGDNGGTGDLATSAALGSDAPHNNMQPSLTVNFIIKT